MGNSLTPRENIEATVILLLQAYPNGVSAVQIAEQLGCRRQTVYDYLNIIKADYPHTDIHAGHGRFCLDPAVSLYNVRLHPSEALTIYLALRRYIRHLNQAPDFMISAIYKVLPALMRPDLVENLHSAASKLQAKRPPEPARTAIWETLMQGWREQRVVRIDYQNYQDKEVKTRDVEPHLFEPMPFGDSNYIIAYCHMKQDWRTFKFERIQRATLTMQTFEQRRIDIDALIGRAWGIDWGEERTERIVLKFDPQVAERVMESVYHDSEEKRLLSDGSLLWVAEIGTLREISSWIQGWGSEVEVLEPASLRQTVIDEFTKALKKYGENSD